ncbi:hypothetical protein EW145_g4930 [Phellinidium pouzarii]|uniref:Uncharacterized protein n=1 Tax=Phellinidium pouzarii TaxID=167371 RepID=A0A4S4L1Z2_9AGAM|nr:hypothetical protein EW145_g4930 [Phellinidium pouzarii]
MAHCNINIVKPEDEVELPFTNALHFQTDIGNHFGTPFNDKYILPSSIDRYSYPHTSSGFINNSHLSRPHLTQLSTGTYFPEMQHASNSSGRSNSFCPNSMESNYATDENASSMPSEWVFVHDIYADPNSPSNFVAGSPAQSHGWSPLTPNTPLLSVEPSPTASSYPSPGSQGSCDSSGRVLMLSPSPDVRSSSVSALSETTTGLHTSPVSPHAGMHPAQYYSQYGADVQLPSPHMYPQTQAHQETYSGWNNLGENMDMVHYTDLPENYIVPSTLSPSTFSHFPSMPSLSPGEQASHNRLPSDVPVHTLRSSYNLDALSAAPVPVLHPAFRGEDYHRRSPIEIPSAPIFRPMGGEQHTRSRLPSTSSVVTAYHSAYDEQDPHNGPSSEDPASVPFLPYSTFPQPGPVVPQKIYKPQTASDQRRYVEEVRFDPPIYFHSQNPMQNGISLTDALASRFNRLLGRDDPLFQTRGPSISVRLVWPCYDAWSRQIPTRDFKSPPGPITRCKLAKNVAKTILRSTKIAQWIPGQIFAGE